MPTLRLVLAMALLQILTACGTTQVGLRYAAPAGLQVASGAQPISVGTFVDQRGEPANWLGAIRGGFGNPLKNLETSSTVSSLVEAAILDAVRVRGFSSRTEGAKLQLAGSIKKLYCNQVMQREANVEIEVNVIDLDAKRTVFNRTYSATNYESGGAAVGVFASPDDLRALTERTLREVIDKLLDDSALRAALRA